MSNPKLSVEATTQPIQKTESSEFDPVQEIRKLRQNLTHRIQVLHSPATTPSNTPVSVVNGSTTETQEITIITTTEPTEKIETINDAKELGMNTLLPITAENKIENKQTSEFLPNENESEFPANGLVQQIHQARQLLAQLQVTPHNNKPPSISENNKPKNITVSKTEHLETSEQFFPPLIVLKMINTVLTWCGFVGILFSFQYLEHDNRFGLTIITAGLILIIVGLLGRFYAFTLHKKNSDQSFAL
ncbi:MAG: hypothetical protein LBC20_12990 [Planctomycetaceae bacterium]|jgi:hypothetical protein|nr:hypothetical protein [Planctomycetaceae bacterium]